VAVSPAPSLLLLEPARQQLELQQRPHQRLLLLRLPGSAAARPSLQRQALLLLLTATAVTAARLLRLLQLLGQAQ
jgi:hypothetical protein